MGVRVCVCVQESARETHRNIGQVFLNNKDVCWLFLNPGEEAQFPAGWGDNS